MLDKILRLIEKIIPKKIYRFFQPVYHFTLSYLGAVIYRFPSRHINVIAVTGTKGKTTTTELLNAVLEKAGYKTALQNGIRFTIGNQEERNMYKMSMPGRFFIQRFLRKAVDNKCDWAILEITSEGAKFYRHRYINLDAFIFTNLSPEHIESHGSYEAYREAKLSIADSLNKKSKYGFLITNEEDKESKHFLKKPANKYLSFKKSDVDPYEITDNGIQLRIGKTTIYSKLRGEFNLENIVAVITFAKALGLSDEQIKEGIESLEKVPGRVEKVKNSKNIEAYVDYAHTPDSLEALYKEFEDKKTICVLGNTGGGRDTWKRPEMATIADKYCDEIILTNEDPYDEDPEEIVDSMAEVVENTPVKIILDRRAAIGTAIKMAVNTNRTILITGKGTDPYIMEANNKKTPWNDYEITSEEIEKLNLEN